MRVALVATVLAAVSFSVVGGVQLIATSQSFTELANQQAFTITLQLASVAPGSERTLAGAIPYSPDGLDGLLMFNRQGRVLGSGGALGSKLASLAPHAKQALASGHTVQLFRARDGHLFRTLRPWSDPHALAITIQPYTGGVVVTAFHSDWAIARLHRAALRTALGLLGGALFICLGLLLILGRLFTSPLERLAREVRHLGEGNLVMRLSEQSSPELDQLAADIAQMRDDLTEAMRRSTTDPLTGIANHRAFHDRLDEAVEVAEAEGRELALIAVDLDNLKTINDRNGHLVGDRVLAAVASAIAGACREGDLCARVGGDEFLVLCPDVDARAASAIGERILAAAREATPADGVQVSVSVGVCDIENARSKDDLVHCADAALYQAKAAGRDRVEILEGAR
jgi:diguanylate cyclase (GGDEF)-like protein